MEITGHIKNYDWGKLGEDSEVARLALLNVPDFKADPETPYSELWMGDHCSGTAKVKGSGEDLSEVISKDKAGLIGGHENLPFLFKVLSIRKALSVQVHPNKEEAARLHAVRPDLYKDPNHKPELAIALTPFLAMCGFRPYEEIVNLCMKFKPLVALVGKENIENIKDAHSLRSCFSVVMSLEADKIGYCVNRLLKEYAAELEAEKLLEIFTKISQDFPNDGGIFCLFFCNIVRLNPGEAIFLAANEIHAYLEGDCVECMACSDNVVRAGLTPKFKDVASLIRMLNCEGGPAEQKIFQPVKKDNFLDMFAPPDIKDFAVAKLELPPTEKNYKLKNEKCGAILLVLQGKRLFKAGSKVKINVARGSIIFIPGNSTDLLEFLACGGNTETFVGYIAMYNSF